PLFGARRTAFFNWIIARLMLPALVALSTSSRSLLTCGVSCSAPDALEAGAAKPLAADSANNALARSSAARALTFPDAVTTLKIILVVALMDYSTLSSDNCGSATLIKL